MSKGKEFPLSFVKPIAYGIVMDIIDMDVCHSVSVVGSVRRGKPVVHDIEILCIPKRAPSIDDMFGVASLAATVSLFDTYLPDLARAWKSQIVTNGEKLKRLCFEELPIEICISSPERWGVEMVIKTGPSEFSKKCVTIRQHDGYLPSNCNIRDGWKVFRNETYFPMENEIDFLEFIGLGWIEPGDRK
jgi:DNA polymerase/3'-5' exonuclease PolX